MILFVVFLVPVHALSGLLHMFMPLCAVFTYMVSRWIDLWLDLFVNVPSSNRFLLINPFKTQPQHKNRSGDPLSSAIRLLPSQSWLLRIKSGGERSMSFSASIHPLMRTKVKKHKLFHSVSFVFSCFNLTFFVSVQLSLFSRVDVCLFFFMTSSRDGHTRLLWMWK